MKSRSDHVQQPCCVCKVETITCCAAAPLSVLLRAQARRPPSLKSTTQVNPTSCACLRYNELKRRACLQQVVLRGSIVPEDEAAAQALGVVLKLAHRGGDNITLWLENPQGSVLVRPRQNQVKAEQDMQHSTEAAKVCCQVSRPLLVNVKAPSPHLPRDRYRPPQQGLPACLYEPCAAADQTSCRSRSTARSPAPLLHCDATTQQMMRCPTAGQPDDIPPLSIMTENSSGSSLHRRCRRPFTSSATCLRKMRAAC